MKKLILFMVLILMGCSTANIPIYLQGQNPYTQRFYVEHAQALIATKQALEDLGWKIDKTIDPLVYEQKNESAVNPNETLIITDIRQTPMFIGTRYAKINAYVRSQDNSSEIELRYLTVTSLVFKNFETYRNDKAVDRIFRRIEEVLNKK